MTFHVLNITCYCLGFHLSVSGISRIQYIMTYIFSLCLKGEPKKTFHKPYHRIFLHKSTTVSCSVKDSNFTCATYIPLHWSKFSKKLHLCSLVIPTTLDKSPSMVKSPFLPMFQFDSSLSSV